MRFIIGLMIFWISILGIKWFIEKRFLINEMFSLPLTFTIITIIVFISGILNMMLLVSLILTLCGLWYFIVNVKNKKNSFSKLIKNPSWIIIAVIFLYITIVGLGMHLMHYDNFSHWGLIARNMLFNNALPNFDDAVIYFKGYQPGSACFIYYFGILCGKNEGCMIIAQNIFVFSFLTPLFYLIKGNKINFKHLLLIVFYVFIMSISIRFNDLLVDSLIATIMISSIVLLNFYRKDLKKCFWYCLPFSILLFLVKNTGLFLAGCNCLLILYYGIKNKEKKQGTKYAFITALILLFALIIWQSHVTLAFGPLALKSKHSLSIQNFGSQIFRKGIGNMLLLLKKYTYHFFSLRNNLPNIFMLLLNLTLGTFALNKKTRKKILNLILLCNAIYVIYYIMLVLMYLFSMPMNEALVFASYTRYMGTIIIIIIGIVFINIMNFENMNYNYLLVLVLMLGSIYYYRENFISFIGKDNYENSVVEKYDNILKNIDLEQEEKYYIYSPSSEGDNGYLKYVSKYKLQSSQIQVITLISDIEEDSYIITIEKDEKITNYLEKNKYYQVSNSIYKKECID